MVDARLQPPISCRKRYAVQRCAARSDTPECGGRTDRFEEREVDDAMAGQKIRIRLKSYDHEVIDSSARKIVDTVTRAGATVSYTHLTLPTICSV